MIKEHQRQFIAVFLIFLIVNLVYYSPSVYAAIDKVTVKGSSGVDGLAKKIDFVTFTVQASIEGDSIITKEQVVLGTEIPFNDCKPLSGGFECRLRNPPSGTEDFGTDPLPYQINLCKDDPAIKGNMCQKSENIVDTITDKLLIDSQPPVVKLAISQNSFSSQQNVVVNAEAADTACSHPDCSGICSGIKSIEFYTLDNSFKQTVEPVNNECVNKTVLSIEPKKFKDGKNSVFAKATDKFGQVSSAASVTFDIDTTAPVILANSFAITTREVPISSFSLNSVPVEIAINVSGADLNANSVAADLSALNPVESLKDVKGVCAPVRDNLHVCRWSIELNPGTAGSKKIVVNASDSSGNKASVTVSRQFSLDDKGPVVQSISTGASAAGKALAKLSGNTVTAAFDEATYLIAEQVFLYVDEAKAAASKCSKQANWVCVWENINLNNGAKVSIRTDTTDILGNPVAEQKSVDVAVDSQKPALTSLEISAVGGAVQAFADVFKIGDKIAVAAKITEDNDVAAVADFSKFISGASKAAGKCERKQSNEHLCTWSTDSINLAADEFITFNFTDLAGNELIEKRQIKTFGIEDSPVPDFWDNTVQCSPKVIDRQLGPLISQKLYCHVKLSPKVPAKEVSTVFISPAVCTGGSSVIQSAETFNAEPGSTSPFIKLTLKKNDLRLNAQELICSINIFSKITADSKITKNPEIENVKINLEFVNFPLGEVGDAVQQKIDEAKKDAQGIWKTVGALKKVVNTATKICQTLQTIFYIVSVYFLLTRGLGDGEKACRASGILNAFGVCEIFYVAGTSSCGVTEGLDEGGKKSYKYLSKFCEIVTCKIGLGPDIQSKLLNAPGLDFIVKEGETTKQAYDFVNQVQYGKYANPQNNLILALIPPTCLPGVINGLDKFRQIKCLYADCLENSVAKEGLPVTACEDQKAYATCKHVTGEIFAVLPWTAVFDHFAGLAKTMLSDPLTAAGFAVSVFCKGACPTPDGKAAYTGCRGSALFKILHYVSELGTIAQNVDSLIKTKFEKQQDYCSRLDFDEKKSPESK